MNISVFVANNRAFTANMRQNGYMKWTEITKNVPDMGATSNRALTYLGLSLNFSTTGKYSSQKQFI